MNVFLYYFGYQIKEKTLSISDVNLPALLFIVEELKAEDYTHREAVSHYIFVCNTCITYKIQLKLIESNSLESNFRLSRN